ncbi:MAG: radical SAM protein [Candidatus Gastranaerophilales bacterium]|nr:radical SAM protein [Candidatus Gastranaerophilales bacterium]
MNGQELTENIRTLNKEKIKEILLYKNQQQEELFSVAREIRQNGKFGNNAELRSVIEISNLCTQKCRYCGMGRNGKEIYTLSNEVIIDRITNLAKMGRRTFLLQSGENQNQKFVEDIAYCCREAIKKFPDIKIILCMGNLEKEQYKLLKDSGATRYILKFETSNAEHHKRVRPSDSIEHRLSCIQSLIDLGFQTGSGNIVGLPYQTLDNLVDDLVLIDKLNLAMVSATKFIPNEFSEFKDFPAGDIDITLNFLAILRILKPDCLIPSTTSLSTGHTDGQKRGLEAGCNTVTIHDGTPKELEENYSIYSEKRFSPGEEFCRKIVLDSDMVPQVYLI